MPPKTETPGEVSQNQPVRPATNVPPVIPKSSGTTSSPGDGFQGSPRATKLVTGKANSWARRLVGALNREIDRGNSTIPFIIMMLLASFKDFLDAFPDAIITLLQPIIGPGQVASIVIWCIQVFVDAFLVAVLAFFLYGKGFMLRTRVKVVFWLLSVADILPWVGSLPLQMTTVLYAWKNVKKRAAKARKKMAELKKIDEQEAEQLYNDMSLLDREQG